ncbi:hypothetical protein ZHAS_00020981 [Anopheles sinensis]|uniref:Uncharacterized protein n=1 Tax=Anopheles sinensis TaxID=74873 RepID=A0A084WR63_ANOSI|nr:hypothetical protein ZHAS_00020981 [Anopheles sinensis]
MKPHFIRRCNAGQRLLICAVFLLNLFTDLATIDGHVLPRPLTTTSLERNSSTGSTTPTVVDFSTDLPESYDPLPSPSYAATDFPVSGTRPAHSATPSAPVQPSRSDPHGTIFTNTTINATAGRVLVVIPANFSGVQLRREFSNFVRLLQSGRAVESNEDELTALLHDSRILFRPWQGMASLERWLEDATFGSVLYMSDESDSFIGYCDSLSTHLSAVYRKPVLFWPCPRMKVSLGSSLSSGCRCVVSSGRTFLEGRQPERSHRFAASVAVLK